ncbi:MAG: DUF1223 domain-containing protein [Hyphomonas sp.]|nr:DUF1223 domain-containing protein [Hyphomonas sp.]
MRILLGSLIAAIAAVAALNMNGGAQSLQDIPLATGASTSPIVAELFTSQSCSSCPPAEKLFSELAERNDLIVLEWHVDYWDRLVHGRAGAWKDPFSSAAYTKRQRDYNRALRGTGAVYTPQAVINGVRETVGSHRPDVEALIQPARHATATVSISTDGETRRVEIEDYVRPLEREADIVQLTLLRDQTTSVARGENRGVVLSSRNVVVEAQTIGSYDGTAKSVAIKLPDSEHECAIIIQEQQGARLGPIIGASYCH